MNSANSVTKIFVITVKELEQFKDLLSSMCQVSPKRIVLDLESKVMRGPGSIPTGGIIFY